MSISRKFSKYNGRSWLSDIVANTPTLSKKRSTNGAVQSPYKNGSGSIRSVSHSSPLYPIITGSAADNQVNLSPSYPIITSTRQRSTSLQQKAYHTSNSSLMKTSTLKSRKELPVKLKLYDVESPVMSGNPERNKKHSAPPLLQHGQHGVEDPTATHTLYDSVALDMPTMSQGYKINKPPRVGHYKKKEQKKTFIDSGCKTLDRNHFSRIRVRAYF